MKYARPLFVFGALALLVSLERRRPLRSKVESAVRHNARNIAAGTLSALTIALTEKPVADRLTKIVEKKRIGLLPQLNLPKPLEHLLAIVLLDYTLYIWHVLTHKVGFLWRFHEVHHEDLDLTATSALRFHFGEMALSTFWRGMQIVLIGVSSRALAIWQTALLIEIMFHHSNIRLPERIEGILSRIVVTPRMHTIHHSTVREETDSNWSSGLTLWDWLHGTLRWQVPHREIKIGVPAYGTVNDIRFTQLLLKPFQKQRASWNPLEEKRVMRSHVLAEHVSFEHS